MASAALDLRPISEDPHLETRVVAVQECIKRTRFALFLCILSAGAVIVCLWNTYISSDRDLAFLPLPYQIDSASPGDPGGKTLAGQRKARTNSENPDFALDRLEAYRQLLPQQFKAWVDSQFISVNLLGIRISVSDFDVLASFGLNFFLFYFLLCARRENREVGLLFSDFYHEAGINGAFNIRNLSRSAYSVFVSVTSYMIFNLNKRDDSPIWSLKGRPKDRKLPGIRMTALLLNYSTVIAIALVVLCEVMSDFVDLGKGSSFFTSPFRLVLGPIKNTSNNDRIVEMWATLAIAVVLGCVALYITKQIRMYQDATRTILDEFHGCLANAGYFSKTLEKDPS
jgi:hypothetical protein